MPAKTGEQLALELVELLHYKIDQDGHWYSECGQYRFYFGRRNQEALITFIQKLASGGELAARSKTREYDSTESL